MCHFTAVLEFKFKSPGVQESDHTNSVYKIQIKDEKLQCAVGCSALPDYIQQEVCSPLPTCEGKIRPLNYYHKHNTRITLNIHAIMIAAILNKTHIKVAQSVRAVRG